MKKLGAVLALLAALAGAAAAQTALYSHVASTGLVTSLLVESNPSHVLAGFNCTGIAGGSAGFCVAYNSATVPSTGALTGSLVLDFCYFDTTARGCSLSRIPGTVEYSGGIVILLTSAASPYTYMTGTDTGAISADFQ